MTEEQGKVVQLTKEELVKVLEEVVDCDTRIDRGSDHRSSVRSLEVSFHDLVELSVTEDKRLQGQAPRPQQINGFLVLIRESECVVVPSELQSLQLGAVFGQGVDHVVDVNLGGDVFHCSHHQNFCIDKLGQNCVPKLICDMAHPGAAEALQLVPEPLSELDEHVLGEVVRCIHIQGLQTCHLA